MLRRVVTLFFRVRIGGDDSEPYEHPEHSHKNSFTLKISSSNIPFTQLLKATNAP